jgi:hypothetical protein
VTAAALPASQHPRTGAPAAAVPWRKLVRATARQHRAALLWTGVAIAVLAIALLATGLPVHEFAARQGANWQSASQHGRDADLARQAFGLILELVPVLAGMFLGAPLLAREVENGTARMAWTQAASRTRWLLAQVIPFAGLLALAALGLAAEFEWWRAPFPADPSVNSGSWSPLLFNVSPLPLAGWIVFGLALGIFLGAAIRRTLPAMAATLACYGALLFVVSTSWRMHYLPPLHRSFAVPFMPGGGYSYSIYWAGHPVILSNRLGWPGGRLLSNAELLRPASWMRLHHIVAWVTYQLSSRYHTLQLIELGWLIAVSALLLAATALIIRRRPA